MRQRGKRSGRAPRPAELRELRDIHSKVRGVHRMIANPGSPTGAVLERSKIRHSIADLDETEETHVIPRKSVTVRQLLRVTAQPERETIHARQLDHKGFDGTKYQTSDEAIKAHRMIETTDERIIAPAERSLLINGEPGAKIGTFYRQGAIRKGLNKQRIITKETETPITDQVLGTAVEILNSDAFDAE